MKKSILLSVLCLSLVSLHALGQEEAKPFSTSRPESSVDESGSAAESSIEVQSDKDGNDSQSSSFGIDMAFGINNFMERKGGGISSGTPYTLNPSQARNFKLAGLFNLAFDSKARFGLKTGLELDYHNFAFKNANVAEENENVGVVNFAPRPLESIRKSKLRVTYLNLPLMFTFDTERANAKKGFHIALGADAGLRLGYKSIVKYDKRADKVKTKGQFMLEDVRYGLRGEIGYAGVNLFLQYSLTPTFKSGAGPDVNMFSIGLKL